MSIAFYFECFNICHISSSVHKRYTIASSFFYTFFFFFLFVTHIALELRSFFSFLDHFRHLGRRNNRNSELI